LEIGQGSRPYGTTLYQKVEIFFIFLRPHSHPPGAIEVKFCTAKRTHVYVVPAKFDVNRCNESPLWGEKPDFWPVSKFNTGSLPLCGILPVTNINKTSQICGRDQTRTCAKYSNSGLYDFPSSVAPLNLKQQTLSLT